MSGSAGVTFKWDCILATGCIGLSTSLCITHYKRTMDCGIKCLAVLCCLMRVGCALNVGTKFAVGAIYNVHRQI
eukprot:833736-Pelagomonas_calceolata.AAC.4